MAQAQKLLDLALKIGEVDENYKKLAGYNDLSIEEKHLCDVLYGDSNELTRIILSADQILAYIKICAQHNGYYKAGLDEAAFETFIKEVLFQNAGVYKKIRMDTGIMVQKKGLSFNEYDEDFMIDYREEHSCMLQHIAVLDLGEGLYIGLPLLVGDYKSHDFLTMNILGKVLRTSYVLDSDQFFEFYEVYNSYRESHISEKTMSGDLRKLAERNNALKLSKDEIFKLRFEKSMNPEFKLHLKIYETTKEFITADTGEAAFISEASRNYNPAIKKIYSLYEEINAYYLPFMTDADYLILYWMRFKIAELKHNDVLAEELGIKILEKRKVFRKLPETFYKYTNHALPLQGSKGELLRDFSNYYSDDIVFQLLNYYVKNFRYDEAYEILKNHDSYFSRYLSENGDEKTGKVDPEKLAKDAQWDIGLIVADLDCTFNEHIRQEWSKRIDKAVQDFKKTKLDMNGYGRYKKMSQYIGNVIIVMVTKQDYMTAKSLLTIYNKYLIKDEDYEALEKFVSREAEIRSTEDLLQDLLGLFSLESESTHQFLNSFYELTNTEMTADISLSENENKIIRILSNDKGYDYEHCFKLIKNAQEKYIKRMDKNNLDSDFFSAYFDTGLKKLAQLMKKEPLYEEIEVLLAEEYTVEIWDKFTDETRKYLVTGKVLYESLKSRPDSKKYDYSPICLCWARSVESEFQKKLFAPLIRAYNNSLHSPDGIKYPQSSFLLPKNKVAGSNQADIKNFTLGSLKFVCGINRYGNNIGRDDSDWSRFNQFLKDHVYKTMNDAQRKNHIIQLIGKSEKLNYDYRIKAAHPLETISKDELEGCRDIVFQSQELLKLIVKDMDDEWPIKALSFG